MEDLNYLLSREQQELMRAQGAACHTARAAHSGLASGYARKIRDHRLPYRTPSTAGRVAFDPKRSGFAGIAVSLD